MKREIRERLLSIALVSAFLIFMTAFVYLPKQENLSSAFAFLNNQKSFYLHDISEGVLLKNAIPTKDSEGLKNDPYVFEVVNNSNKNITYSIVFKNNEEKAKAKGMEVLDNHYLKYAISDTNDTDIEANILPDDGVMLTTTITPHSKQQFNFRMWLDYDADDGSIDKVFIGSLEVVKK